MRRTILILGLLVALAACAEDEPEPAAQAEQSLDQFSEAVDRMESKAEDLSEEVDDLQQQLRESLDKHLAMLNTRLSDFESRIVALPAEQETQLRRPYSELIAQTGEVKQLFKQWMDASGDQAEALRQRLEEARDQLDESFNHFEQRLAEVEGA